MRKWEYKVIAIDTTYNNGIGKLNQEGEEGWELVSVLDYYSFYFKRPISVPRLRKKCGNPECKKSFITARKDKRYCSEDCANWAQKKAKRKYWHKRKEGNRV